MKLSIFLTTSVATLSNAASLVRVNSFGKNPTNLQMNIWVPDKLGANPGIVLALHPCGGTGEQYAQQTRYTSLSASKNFIVIFPSTKKDNNCWEVNTVKGLSRNAGGDNEGLANMINYTITKYTANAAKVFVTGSSSGCMMTNVMAVTYPDLFNAASCYSGVPAGCLAGSPGASPSTADPACAAGRINKSQADWVKQARAMYPSYNGTYPRFAVWHGTGDNFVNYYNNYAEQLKLWSGLLGVTFSKNVTSTPQSGYTQMVYGDGTKVVGYSAQGVGHTVPVHDNDDMKWFGL